VFTARYALSPYIKQIRFVFEGLIESENRTVSSEIRKLIMFEMNKNYLKNGSLFLCLFMTRVTKLIVIRTEACYCYQMHSAFNTLSLCKCQLRMLITLLRISSVVVNIIDQLLIMSNT
jgi:hypothetical protein